MQARHFEFIAKNIREANLSNDARMMIAAQFATSLRETNEKFDTLRFMEACIPFWERND